MIYYDLHIHSCLSPCADDDMTPNNIVNMAKIKGLDLIGICDHNTVRQLDAFSKIAKDITILYGIEVETIEEVHILGLFKALDDIKSFDEWLEDHKMKIKNDIAYFGHQIVMDKDDEVIDEHGSLLITSTDIAIDTCIDMIHTYGGIAILAHVLDRKNSIIEQLGFIPEAIKADAIEVKNEEEIKYLKKTHPYLKDHVFVNDSDAHRLSDISEREHMMSEKTYRKLWGPWKI